MKVEAEFHLPKFVFVVRGWKMKEGYISHHLTIRKDIFK